MSHKGLPLSHARRLSRKEPWTYATVLDELDELVLAQEQNANSSIEENELEQAKQLSFFDLQDDLRL